MTIHFGELTVSEDYFKYKKMHFSKPIGTYPLDLPPLKFTTKGLWFTVPKQVKDTLEDMFPNEEEVFAGGLHGAEHALIGLFPLHTMCDRFDIGGLSTNYHEDTQEATIFIYDGYEGGIGITEKAVDVFVDLLKSTIDLLENCGCKSGCPACIYSPKCGNDNKPLHKNATKYILTYMCKLISKNESVQTEIIEAATYLDSMAFRTTYPEINRILLAKKLDLSQGLVGEAVAHYKAGVTGCATQVYQSSIGQKNYTVSVLKEVTVYLRLYVLALDARYLLEFVHLNLAVKVADVADDSLIRHGFHMLGGYDIYVTCCGHKDISKGSCLLHCYNLVSLHCSLQGADGVNLGNQHAGSV